MKQKNSDEQVQHYDKKFITTSGSEIEFKTKTNTAKLHPSNSTQRTAAETEAAETSKTVKSKGNGQERREKQKQKQTTHGVEIETGKMDHCNRNRMHNEAL